MERLVSSDACDTGLSEKGGSRSSSTDNALFLFYFHMKLLQRNIDRVNKLVASLVSTGAFVQSLFTWQYKFRSAFAFAVSVFRSRSELVVF